MAATRAIPSIVAAGGTPAGNPPAPALERHENEHHGVPPAVPVLPVGGYMGEGLMPVPAKLVRKIHNLEFVEMRDMLPETWLSEEEETTRNMLALPRRKSAQLTNILQWVQCFEGMVGVLATRYPQTIPEVMSYMATIVKCSRDFDGVAWAQYDRAYRRQAAQTKDLHWSRLNPTLFSLCFAGKARRNVACTYCLSDNHGSDGCPENPSKVTLPWQVASWTTQHSNTPPRSAKTRICYLYNSRQKSECSYDPCRFTHVCSICKGNHPRSECSRGQREPKYGARNGTKRPREE